MTARSRTADGNTADITNVQPEGEGMPRVDREPAASDLADALAGDRDAWDRIVANHSRLLWWVAKSYRLDESTAADVVQTVWLQLIRFGDRIEDPKRLPAWLSTTTRRECMRRVASRDIPSEWVEEEPDRHSAEPDEELLDHEMLDIVLAAFSQLSADDQRLLRLLCDEPPKSYEEIAALLGRTPGYIGPTRQRALVKLRALVQEMGLE